MRQLITVQAILKRPGDSDREDGGTDTAYAHTAVLTQREFNSLQKKISDHLEAATAKRDAERRDLQAKMDALSP